MLCQCQLVFSIIEENTLHKLVRITSKKNSFFSHKFYFNQSQSRPRIYYSGEYVPRERCREDYYPIASTPATEIDSLANNSVASPPNVSSVLYTVQRVVTTSQIQTATSFAPNNSVTTVANAVRNDSDSNAVQSSPGKLKFIWKTK